MISHGEQGYTANLPLGVMDDDDVMLAYEADGEPLGARARLSAAPGRARSATSGSRPSGCAASSSRPPTSRASGSATATTTTPTRSSSSDTRLGARRQTLGARPAAGARWRRGARASRAARPRRRPRRSPRARGGGASSSRPGLGLARDGVEQVRDLGPHLGDAGDQPRRARDVGEQHVEAPVGRAEEVVGLGRRIRLAALDHARRAPRSAPRCARSAASSAAPSSRQRR